MPSPFSARPPYPVSQTVHTYIHKDTKENSHPCYARQSGHSMKADCAHANQAGTVENHYQWCISKHHPPPRLLCVHLAVQKQIQYISLGSYLTQELRNLLIDNSVDLLGELLSLVGESLASRCDLARDDLEVILNSLLEL